MSRRKSRRAAVRQKGMTWKQARALRRQIAAAKDVEGKALRLTPEQARHALAEWAARGGKNVDA